MSQTEATEILRAVYGRVSRRIPAKWVTSDAIEGAYVRPVSSNGMTWSETKEVLVCRHGEWKTVCDDCDYIVSNMRLGATFEAASAARAERRKKIAEEEAKFEATRKEAEERQMVEEAESERDAIEAGEWARTVKAAEDEFYAKPVDTPIKDKEVSQVVAVITDQYRARQKDSFEKVGGGPQGWVSTEINDIAPNGQIIYDLPQGYTRVTPYTDTFGPNPAGAQCELCGHWIVYPCPIQNDQKRLLMFVGSECVNNFMGAGYVTKQVKKFRETKLRVAYGEWRQTAIAEVQTRSRNGWLSRPDWLFEKKLDSGLPEELSSRKIKNLFKKAQELGITIPEGILTEPKQEEAGEEEK